MYKVSVIVPVYNVDKYLSACLDSILAQTLQDLEVICVDDGSTDRSGEILDAYAKRDARIRVIHKENAGYGVAMNVGMDAAQGEYIGIVESDDWIDPDFYERLYQVAREENLDLVKSDSFFSWGQIGYDYRIHNGNLEEYYGKILTSGERRISYQFRMNTWTGIYRTSFLRRYGIGHSKTPGASYQDNGFWFQSLTFFGRALWLPEAYYHYRQDNPGASVKDLKKVMAMSVEFDYIEKLLQEKNAGKEALDACNYYRLNRNFGTFKRIADECKRGFCDRLILDYQNYGALLGDNVFLKDWYETVCRDPDAVCRKIMEKKAQMRQRIGDAKKIFIYGAGNRGQRLFRHFCYMQLLGKLAGFVISGEPEERMVCGQSVRSLHEVVDQAEDAVFFISASAGSSMHEQMQQCLEERGIHNHVDAQDVFEYFYALSD